MKIRSRVTIAAFAMILSLAGCANLFTTNYFESFAGPPSASDISYDGSDAAGYLDELEDAMESDRFIDSLSDTQRDALTDDLEDIYTTSTDAAVIQEAALLAAELQMNGTGAGETANNVVDLFMNSSDGSDNVFEDPDALLSGLIPAEAQGDPVAIAAILNDLVSAGTAFTAFGNSVDDAPPADGVSGEVAQNAAVSILVMTIAGVDPADTPAAREAKIAALTGSVVDGTVSDDYAATDLGTALDDDSPLSNILDAAGFDPSMFGGDE